MDDKLKFIFYTSFSSKLGYGHFNRCKILADELISKGNNVKIYLLNKKKTSFFRENWINYFSNKKKYPKADVCIIDNYIYEDQFYLSLRKYYENLIIFDDFKFKVPDNVMGVINPNIYANKTNYPKNIKVWAGKDFVLLKKEFKKNIKIKSKKNIFLCLGGSDPTLQMNKYINILLKNSSLKINAVFGPGYKNLNDLEKWKKNKRVKVFFNVKKISNIMAKSKYAFSSSGSMLYELEALNIPTLCVSLAKNQELLGESMSDFSNIDYLGYYKKLKKSDLIKAIKKKENSAKKLKNKNLSNNKINFDGSKKLANDLTVFFKKMKKNIPLYESLDIKNEYDQSAKEFQEFKKLRWGSKKSMLNRYNFFISKVMTSKVDNWLDIGSGTGSLQYIIKNKFPKINSIGLEISKELYLISKNKSKLSKFYNMDFLKYKKKKNFFDLISCIGVLPKTNISLNDFLNKSYFHLKKNGILFFDFKNKNWKKFNNKNFFPEVRHKWHENKNIIEEVSKKKYFKILEFVGFDPKLNKIMDRFSSHTNYLVIKKLR